MAKRKRSSEAPTPSVDTTTTPGAVRTMVFGAPCPKQAQIVKLVNIRPMATHDSYVHATICDDQHSAEVFCINKHLKSRSFFRTDGTLSYIVSVKGYVTSPANTQDTLLCITSLDILKVQPAETSPFTLRPPRLPQRVQGGTAGTFLLDRAPLFSEEALAGSQAFVSQNIISEALSTTTDLIAHHHAMKTLHHSSSTTTSTTTENYMAAIREFASAQLDRQKASLTTNSEKVPASQIPTVTSQHKTALEAALAHAETMQELTPATLQQWHALLCGGGLVTEAGMFRRKKVQAGGTSFTAPEQITIELDKLCRAIRTLESRLNTTKSPATLAAAVLIGVLDIHPFCDGNGRLARIATNWALRRAGLPFVINIFATPAQRRDYVTAIQTTRRNLCLTPMKNVSQETLVDIMSKSGLLLPLVQLVVDQVSRAAVECNKLVAEKSAQALDEDETKAARRFREKAAAGTCLICFDERPNVATLCCGKAVHLNCIAQWLSSRNSCPQCRTELPSLPQRVAAPVVNNAAQQEEDDTTSEQWDDTTSMNDFDTTSSNEEPGGYHVQPAAYQHDDDTTEDTSQGSTTEVQQQADDTIFDDTSSYQSNDDTTEDITDDAIEEPSPTRAHLVCSFDNCRNKPATDCTNGGCGRCCVLYGSFGCSRHNA